MLASGRCSRHDDGRRWRYRSGRRLRCERRRQRGDHERGDHERGDHERGHPPAMRKEAREANSAAVSN